MRAPRAAQGLRDLRTYLHLETTHSPAIPCPQTPTYTYLYLPIPTYTYLYLPTPTYTYIHLPTPTYTYLHLAPRKVFVTLAGGLRAEEELEFASQVHSKY